MVTDNWCLCTCDFLQVFIFFIGTALVSTVDQ